MPDVFVQGSILKEILQIICSLYDALNQVSFDNPSFSENLLRVSDRFDKRKEKKRKK